MSRPACLLDRPIGGDCLPSGVSGEDRAGLKVTLHQFGSRLPRRRHRAVPAACDCPPPPAGPGTLFWLAISARAEDGVDGTSGGNPIIWQATAAGLAAESALHSGRLSAAFALQWTG